MSGRASPSRKGSVAIGRCAGTSVAKKRDGTVFSPHLSRRITNFSHAKLNGAGENKKETAQNFVSFHTGRR